MKYLVQLDENKMVIVKGQWPHTKIGDGIVVDKESAGMATHEVGDEFGISPFMLKAILLICT